jgi:hypothetical protein
MTIFYAMVSLAMIMNFSFDFTIIRNALILPSAVDHIEVTSLLSHASSQMDECLLFYTITVLVILSQSGAFLFTHVICMCTPIWYYWRALYSSFVCSHLLG